MMPAAGSVGSLARGVKVRAVQNDYPECCSLKREIVYKGQFLSV
jgi:hypothetical protein